MSKTKALAALLLSCLAGMAQADTSANIYASFEGSISGWTSVDDDNDPDNGPFYPSPELNGFGGYYANLQWPGHSVYGYRDEQYGWGIYENGYGEVAMVGIAGTYLNGGISFPNTANGSAMVYGNGVATYTLLPGATLTLTGYWGANLWLEQEHASGSFELGLYSWEGQYPMDGATETLLRRQGTFSSLGWDGFYADGAMFSYTNDSEIAIQRSFGLYGYLSLDGRYEAPPVTPVPEPETYAMMLAGLATLGFVRRRRLRAESA